MVESNGSVRISWRWLGPTILAIGVLAAGGWVGYMHSQDAFLTARLIAQNGRLTQVEIAMSGISSRLTALESQVGRIEGKVDQLLLINTKDVRGADHR